MMIGLKFLAFNPDISLLVNHGMFCFNFWFLDSDYSSFALLYIEGERVFVFHRILRRLTPSLGIYSAS